jgi:hypothetical protein
MREAHQRKCEAKCGRRGKGSEECQSRTREPAQWKRELIKQNNESDGNDQRGAGKNRGTPYRRNEQKPLSYTIDIGIELNPVAHISSLCVLM